MVFQNRKSKNTGGSCGPELWEIFRPVVLFVLLYLVIQYGCLLEIRHLRASGPGPVKEFIRARPGLCLAVMMVVPTASALSFVYREGKRRLSAFRKVRGEDGRKGKGKKAAIRASLAAAACALCIFFNAQIQVLGLESDSVYAMQPLYREFPFFFVLLLTAVFTPFAEEFVFRGILYTGLRCRLAVLPSVLISAALFGLYHGELLQGTYAFLMGLFFALSMELTGELRMPWILHGISNGLPLCLSCFGVWEGFLMPERRITALLLALVSLGLTAALGFWEKKAGDHAA